MSATKQKSSIIALATLGVYLGLLMAGATPGVLANHGALTRPFDVSDEIEIGDNLDKNPDDERSPVTASVSNYLEDVENFLASLARLQSKGQFDTNKDSFAVTKRSLLPCVDGSVAGHYTPIRFESTSEPSRPAMERFSRGMEYGYSLGDCLHSNAFNGVEATDSRFEFQLGRTEFTVNVCVKKSSLQRSADLARELESTMRLYSTPQSSKLRKTIIESTTFRVQNDQVFVVTRLPRGSLAELIATDAK